MIEYNQPDLKHKIHIINGYTVDVHLHGHRLHEYTWDIKVNGKLMASLHEYIAFPTQREAIQSATRRIEKGL
jgi:hypothetical protein